MKLSESWYRKKISKYDLVDAVKRTAAIEGFKKRKEDIIIQEYKEFNIEGDGR